ncbi:urea ABC transporter ATP-binding subunit UrtE [Cereibacter azotoformans]|uniref:Amino acid/amide ABC transporter ATP-binding protein 2 (HAAT family) n=1 Tax=Cereibacter azotoformans TaxID=43057 RepID=A0A2T5K0P2_9RHOB|nr:urea ABC transporter ATP-binding subunit UrtE [Cereibacter azotoformans]AXQ93103.1 urea ABC transporter ATP-binding subunit UrtE [Cereibacter sphaeroides]MBO4169198.1 urea ABC transporter ATP-binding subunit UrtE [Cereibacter azotoformans]PTR15908.1 amino acid/amide ABC transporter ATP-binding protein 2 (HAAT family) [Cereibacter azotoformans]UIJ31411.1 urea ABC transporter ATP-binding subunit UrtE [Cereibacter azotoformans]
MLKTEGLTLHYGGSQILYGIDMEARAGEVTCIMGTNGVGKTSLLKAIAGAHPRSGGRVILDGEELPRLPPQAMARRRLGFVPQGRMIFPLLTVTENLETGFAVLPRSEHRIPDEIYELFPVLKDMAHRRGGDLSGGQQQQLAIARALIMKPRLLLLDEPTEGIQPNIIQQIGRVISYLRGKGDMAIILVEQYFEFAYGLADRFYVLKRGSVDVAGTKAELGRDRVRQAVSV